ncbi:MAG: hypothetical protein ACRD2W_05870 [Acidimicrobiales bacterium]
MAEFVAGTEERPDVPEVVQPHLTQTADGVWVVWARKAARPAGDGTHYLPLAGGDAYPKDAVATCRRGGRHQAPKATCSCGFHALGGSPPPIGMGFAFDPLVHLDVVLSGRVLAFTWPADHALGGGVLFRAARQTVVREFALPSRVAAAREFRPQEPGGRLARLAATQPRGAGPRRLRVPVEPPPEVAVDDDAGYCRLTAPAGMPALALSPV